MWPDRCKAADRRFDWLDCAVADLEILECRESNIEFVHGERAQSGSFVRLPAPLSASRQKWTAKRGNPHIVAAGRRRLELG
jgi:hypothetical protein